MNLHKGNLARWRCLVELRVVILVEAVAGQSKQLLGSRVRGNQLVEICVLLLSGLSTLSNILVQGSNALAKIFDLFGKRVDGLCGILNGSFEVLDVLLQSFLLVVSSIELLLAVLLLHIIVELFLAQDVNHVDDLLERDLASCQGDRNKIQVCLVGLWHRLEHGQDFASELVGVCCGLDETWSREGLLEKLQSIIVVEDLDGFANSNELFATSLDNLSPLLLLGVASL